MESETAQQQQLDLLEQQKLQLQQMTAQISTDQEQEQPMESSAEAQLSELQRQAQKLKEIQGEVEAEEDTLAESKEDADCRSVYVGNVDYSTTPEELEQHFISCGNINRLNIMADKFGNPKGFAYVEFSEPSMAASALMLNESEFKGRMIKVLPKRTNIPGFNRGGRGGRGRGGRGGRYRSRGRGGRHNPY